MNSSETEAGISPVLSTAGLCVGGQVRLLKSIYDDGEDHHPPGWIAQAGEVLIVKEIHGDVLAVAHEGNPGAFTIYPGEYETHNNRLIRRGKDDRMKPTDESAGRIEPMVVILLGGKKITPPEGCTYRGQHKNRFLPDKSKHLWMDGYYCWRPHRSARVFVR